MSANIERLEMTDYERAVAKAAIAKGAYDKWLAAGRPRGRDVEFWLAAEQDWIGRMYVPHRFVELYRPRRARHDRPDSRRPRPTGASRASSARGTGATPRVR